MGVQPWTQEDAVKLGKAILAVVGATVLLSALVGTASAGRLSTSSQRIRASFARVAFAGGFGTVDCEVAVEGSFHERTISKTAGTLSGFITAANVTRCASGAGTVLREALPWHVQYQSFTGTLPRILTIRASIIGWSVGVREPTFGITCLARGNASIDFVRDTTSGATTEVALSGTTPCSGIAGTLSGRTTNVDNGSGARITVTLI